jgi:hypothetical protein
MVKGIVRPKSEWSQSARLGNTYLGIYPTKKAAARAVDFARLERQLPPVNFPPGDYVCDADENSLEWGGGHQFGGLGTPGDSQTAP